MLSELTRRDELSRPEESPNSHSSGGGIPNCNAQLSGSWLCPLHVDSGRRSKRLKSAKRGMAALWTQGPLPEQQDVRRPLARASCIDGHGTSP